MTPIDTESKSCPPLQANETALVIVDMQNDFVSEKGYVSSKGHDLTTVRETVPVISDFIQTARKAGVKVIHVKTHHYRYTNSDTWVSRSTEKKADPVICLPGSWGAAIIDELKPLDGEPVVIKHRYDAFIDTDLHLILRSMGVRNLIICGTQTNLCVDTTARHAFLLDYPTVLLQDCVSTPETDLHGPTILNFGRHFGYVLNSKDLVGLLR